MFDGNTCPYYGNIYYCSDCQAWVGVHKGTNKALGRLANAELRNQKIIAHRYFDGLWKKKMDQGSSKSAAIGMFDVDQCKRVVEICKKYYHESPPIHN